MKHTQIFNILIRLILTPFLLFIMVVWLILFIFAPKHFIIVVQNTLNTLTDEYTKVRK